MSKYSIRSATDADKWMVLEWRNHPDVRAVMLTDHVIAREEHNTWWQRTMGLAERQLLMFERDGEAVGIITIYEWDQDKATAWWGFYLNNQKLTQLERTSVWLELEQALIKYAEHNLKLHELYCESLRENQLAWTLHQKCGFIECAPPADATVTQKDVVYMKHVFPKNHVDLRPSLLLFASHNTDFLADVLRRQTKEYSQFPYQIASVEFGQYQLDLLNPEQEKINDPKACYLFIERLEDFYPDIYHVATHTDVMKIEERLDAYLAFISALASQRQNRIYVADFALQKGFPHSISEQLTISELKQLVLRFNKKLYQLAEESGVLVLPYASQLHKTGAKTAFSNKYWYLARAPFSPYFLDAYSNAIIGTIFATHALSARALVLDLDNTLWGGVIGDDGIEGISLGGDYPGNLYKDLQSLFAALKARGILLTICSKNTESIALEAINQHADMRLREDDFVSWKINWQPKSANIQALAEELNLGVNSLCFIDDNPVERAEVRQNVPGLFVPELPEDPADWFEFIAQLPELWLSDVNESDKRRAELYKKRVQIKNAEAHFGDRRGFLQSLGMQLRLEKLTEQNFERTYQLFTKTNQFNTATIRYSKDQLKSMIQTPDSLVIHIKSKDKYSSGYEGVAALVITKFSDEWHIDNFVMSCRVMGRDIENAILMAILNDARGKGVSAVVGQYISSAKNAPVADLYSKNAFVADENGKWRFVFNEQTIHDHSDIIALDWAI